MLAAACAAAAAGAAPGRGAVCAAQLLNHTGLGGGFASQYNDTADTGACCALCTADALCSSFTWKGGGFCGLRHGTVPAPKPNKDTVVKVSGVMTGRTPAPPPPPPPPPPPVPAGSQKNIAFVITDDQDLMLGSMQAMPNTVRLLGEGGANLTQFRVNTPICCPSRSTMLTGRYEHNNRVSGPDVKGCMWQNSSFDDNPGFWEHGVVKTLHARGYTTGLFGKVLNNMNSYGCDGSGRLPDGVDRQLVMCTHTFFNCAWVNDTEKVKTGDAPADYTTSVMGNASIAWIRSVLAMGKTHPPFYAWIGPHAPHLPSTPAPWYEDHPIGLLTAPRSLPSYNYSGRDHHPLVAAQPILDDDDAAGIDVEYAKRMRSLLSVDDLIVALHDTLVEFGEWDNTYIFFSSDHGYSLGEFRLPTHKMQVYENCLRVPFLVRGPGIAPGTAVSQLTQFADLTPTMLTLAGAAIPSTVDGRSFAHLVDPSVPPPERPWKDTHLTTYQSINSNHFVGPDGQLTKKGHPEDDATNTHRSIRVVNATHDFLYAEFSDTTVAAYWSWPAAGINFHEYYDMRSDPWQLHNLWDSSPQDVKDALHARLVEVYSCQGASCP